MKEQPTMYPKNPETATINMDNYICSPIQVNWEKYRSIVRNVTVYKDICIELHQLTVMATMNEQGEVIAVAQYQGTQTPRYFVHKSLQGVAK